MEDLLLSFPAHPSQLAIDLGWHLHIVHELDPCHRSDWSVATGGTAEILVQEQEHVLLLHAAVLLTKGQNVPKGFH